jgi:hypothetical protein
MAQLSNKFKLEVLKKQVDLLNDTLKVSLVVSGFQFSQATHGLLANVTASLLAAQYGYSPATLVNAQGVQDNVANEGYVTYNNVAWTATGGDIGPSPGAIIWDDTHPDDIVVGYIAFGSNKTVFEAGIFTIADINIGIGPDPTAQ